MAGARAQGILENGGATLDGPAVTSDRPVLVIASGNRSKIREFAELLACVDVDLHGQPEGLAVEETGSSFAQNARLKAETVARLTRRWALGDDSGLSIDALGGAPGVYSARYADSDRERISRVLRELEVNPYRSAWFTCALAVADPSGRTVLEEEGICRGEILERPVGEGGFGYDPIFWVREAGQTFAEMPAHLKRKLGHRGKAFRQLAPQLRELLKLRLIC